MFSPFRERFSLSCSSPSSSPSSPSSKQKRNSIPSGALATPSSKVGLGTIRDDVSILNDVNMAVGGGALGNTTTSAAAGHGNTSNMTTSGANVMLMKTLKRLPIINERQRWRRSNSQPSTNIFHAATTTATTANHAAAAAAAADLRLLLQLRCGRQIAAGGGGAAAAAPPPLGIHNPSSNSSGIMLRSERSVDVLDQERACSTVVLTISARDLRDTDMDSYSDPFCVVSGTSAGMARSRVWSEIGRTEVINNCLNPDWATKIHATYYFEEQQRLLFEVFDKGPGKERTKIGSATLLLHEIIGANYNRRTVKLYDEGKHYGNLTVTAEEMSDGRQESVYFICSATKLDRKDFLGKCDPFLKISRINEDNTYQLAYRTRYHEQNLNPKWKPFEIHINQLCYGDKDREFLIECYDWDQDGNHDLVGCCRTTVNRLVNKVDVTLPLIHEKKAKKSKKYVDSGQLHFHKVYCWMDYSFLDFISAGTELEFTVAIDFTRSNLPTDDTSSLHHVDDDFANQYEIAIRSIAEICQYYNTSQVFHGYGFGARLPGDNLVHYNFPLNTITNNPDCVGIDGLHEAYMAALNTVQLAGPTDFSPTIRFAARQAAALPDDGSKYSVLLIITDGVISDMSKTKEEIVKASSLPLSIIIVGVGYDSFEEMKVLDSDHQVLSANGRYAKRDIVQFVQLRDFLPPHRYLTAEEVADAKCQLAKEVLQEVPSQLTGYMKSKGIFPCNIPSPPLTPQHQQQQATSQQSTSNSPQHCASARSSLSSQQMVVLPQVSQLTQQQQQQQMQTTATANVDIMKNQYHPASSSSPPQQPQHQHEHQRTPSERIRRLLPAVPYQDLQQMHI